MDPPASSAQAIMKKGKRAAAEYVHKDCCSNHSQRLNEILDILLNPANNIDDWETIDWCRWLVAGGHTPDEFTNIGTILVVSRPVRGYGHGRSRTQQLS